MFFCRDPIQGPDVIRSQYRAPENFLLDYDGVFDLLGNTPEANHAGLMFFSDHGTPQVWRFNHGYGAHTFKWVRSDGQFVYIKYHFIAKHGQRQFTNDEAIRISGEDPDYSKRDLWEAIERGEEIEWTAKVQVMQPHEADPEKLGFDPFDVTKVWPRGQFPMRDFGRLVLNKNPENYHRDVEQAAFSPGSMVPGVEDSPDALLQFRMFFYRDAQYHRLGVNLHQVPVNCPFMAKSYASINQDGEMRVDANHAGNKPYVPNSFAHKFRPDAAEAPYAVGDSIMSRKSHYWHEGKKNDYDQATELWTRVMSGKEKKNTCSNTARWLNRVTTREIKESSRCQTHFRARPFFFFWISPTDTSLLDQVSGAAAQHRPGLRHGGVQPPPGPGVRHVRSEEACGDCAFVVQRAQVQAHGGEANGPSAQNASVQRRISACLHFKSMFVSGT